MTYNLTHSKVNVCLYTAVWSDYRRSHFIQLHASLHSGKPL